MEEGTGDVAKGAERSARVAGGVWAGRRAERLRGRAFKGELRVTMRLSFACVGECLAGRRSSTSDDVGPGRSAGASVTLARRGEARQPSKIADGRRHVGTFLSSSVSASVKSECVVAIAVSFPAAPKDALWQPPSPSPSSLPDPSANKARPADLR